MQFVVLGIGGSAIADVPQLINYQGVLLDSGGQPVTSPTDGIFTIYDDPVTGDSLWAELRTISPGTNGGFSIVLGEITPIDPDIFSGAGRWLGVKVGGDYEMVPRAQLVAVGYAFRVATIDGAAGGTISDSLIITGGGEDTIHIGPQDMIIRGQGGDTEVMMTSTGLSYTGTGDALTVSDANGNVRVTVSVDESGGAITLYESESMMRPGETSQGGRKVEFREGGVLLYGASDADTVCHLLPNGSIIGRGQLTMGASSTAGGDWANVIGYSNTADGDSATVSGGFDNSAGGYAATISGGSHNSAAGAYSVVGGGGDNTASGDMATVAGGAGNTASNTNAAVGGGTSNSAGGTNSTIAGGMTSTATGNSSFIGGGAFNTASGTSVAIAGGSNNLAEGLLSFVGGGEYNKARGDYSVVCGGGGGGTDSNSALGSYTVIGGGRENNIGNYFGSTISGGWQNTISEHYSVIAGGYANSISATKSIIAGGESNTISGYLSAISGGRNHTIEGNFSAIAGGTDNSTSGSHSLIAGGDYDTLGINGDYCLVFGNNVYLNNSYRVGFFESVNHGRLGINRDDRDGGINYPIHVGTSSANGNGAYLTAGGTWTSTSSRAKKDRFEPLDGAEILDRLAAIPIEAWQYKGTNERHIGPVSEDFVAAFNVGTTHEDGSRDNEYLSHGDVAGVALAAIKELNKKTEKISELEDKVARLEALLQRLLDQK